MKGKKLEKRVQFIFKKKSIVDLNKEQMKRFMEAKQLEVAYPEIQAALTKQ